MASTAVQAKSDVRCHIGTEITMGTATLAGDTWNQAPLIDYSWSEKSAPLSVAPHRTDSFSQGTSGFAHLRHDKVFEISLTMKGTASTINRMCGALYEDSTSPNILLGSSPSTSQFKHGSANTVPVTLLFKDGGHNSNDVYFTSCMCTGMELAYGIDSDGGMLKVTATFVTGYEPTEGTLTPTSSTDMGDAVAFNIHNITTSTLGTEDLIVKDFSLNISREVTKVGYDPSNNFQPNGYAIGGYEVTGNLSCKRDSESVDAIDNSGSQALAWTDGTLNISAPKVAVDNAEADFGDNGFMQTIPFRCFYDDASKSNTVVSIATS